MKPPEEARAIELFAHSRWPNFKSLLHVEHVMTLTELERFPLQYLLLFFVAMEGETFTSTFGRFHCRNDFEPLHSAQISKNRKFQFLPPSSFNSNCDAALKIFSMF